MDDVGSNFIENLIKNIQMLCHGNVTFSENLEVIGHLYLNVDSEKRINYIVNEKCLKVNSSITFVSNSFQAEPETKTSRKRKININTDSTDGSSWKLRKTDDNMDDQSTNTPIKKVDKLDVNSVECESPESFFVDTSSIVDESVDGTNFENPNEDNDGEKNDVDDSSVIKTERKRRQPQRLSGLEHLEGASKGGDVEYFVVEMGTQQGRPMLVDSIGYSYNERNRNPDTITWRCTIRNKKMQCPATVAQTGQIFVAGKWKHKHDPKPGLLTSVLITAEARAQANNDFTTPVSEVVKRAMSVKGTEEPSSLPKQSNLARMICRHRQHLREEGLIPFNENELSD